MTDVMAFGEILWDIIDGVPHIGGAPFNFAAHVAKCGLKSSIVSSVGNDDLGRRAKDQVAALGVDGSFVSVHPSLPTGTVNVTLTNGIPSYEIVKPVAWDEIRADVVLLPPPRAFYFGSLAQRSSVSSETLARLLEAFSSSLVFFDVNLRQRFWSKELIEDCLAQTDILKVNDEEMLTLGFAAERLFATCPRLKAVIETRGADGCAVWSRDGESFTSPALPDGPVVDTVGAGDSFSAAFLAAVLNGKDLRTAAADGNRRAGQVAARSGAIPEEI